MARLVSQCCHSLRVRQKQPPFTGEGHLLSIPVEEQDTEILLQLLDSGGNTRSDAPKCGGSARHASMFGDGQKDTERRKIHVSLDFRISSRYYSQKQNTIKSL